VHCGKGIHTSFGKDEMTYRHKLVNWDEAIAKLDSAKRVLLPPGCGEPQGLIRAIVERADRFQGLELMGGLLLTDYPFLDKQYARNFHFVTTHIMPPVRKALEQGRAEFLSVRYSDIPRYFSRKGPRPADAILIQVSPPDEKGRFSLGPSTSYPLPVARQAPLVIAQVNPKCPRTMGESFLEPEKIDCLVEFEEDLVPYESPPVGDVERKIAEHILPLIPKTGTIQIGIGNVPEALLECLPVGLDLNIAGMAVDYMADLVEKGVVTGEFRSIELMGTKKLFEFCHDNPRVQMQSSTEGHNPLWLKNIPGFVSINSAVEVDFAGQVNSESIGTRQLSSVGGQYDFVEAAHWSKGGFSVFAFPATSGPEGQYSRIVPRLSHGAFVTTPRYMVRYVVTEYGIADLWGKTTRERADALIGIAHPKFQQELENEFKRMFG